MRSQKGKELSVAENRKQNSPLDDEVQSKRFIEDAKQLGVDETGELFENAFGVVASSMPKADQSRPKDEA